MKRLVKAAKRVEYVRLGKRPAQLSKLLPGVAIHVLGPPDVIKTPRNTAEDQYWPFWHATSRAAAQAATGAPLFPSHVVAQANIPIAARHFCRRASEVTTEALKGAVEVAESATNNTSIILVFEAGPQRLLFPGDAQAESWEQASKDAPVRKLLNGVTLYKVGHHGSHNGTPTEALWEHLKRRGPKGKRGRLEAVLSVTDNKFGGDTEGEPGGGVDGGDGGVGYAANAGGGGGVGGGVTDPTSGPPLQSCLEPATTLHSEPRHAYRNGERTALLKQSFRTRSSANNH